MRAVVVVDGEHYPPVVRDAIRSLPHEVVAAYLAGGVEKLRGDYDDYGVPVVRELDDALALEPDVVFDLSDEPVLGPRERLALASRVLVRGVPYVGADFRLEPPDFEPLDVPALAVIGTGKRAGKTAVTGHAARLLGRERKVVVVAMGRGGPPEPELVVTRPGLDELLERSRRGAHAASDHLETAAVTGVTTVGCRRCGGGLAGAPAVSNVAAGVELALECSPDLLIFDGSGTALPPVAADARVLAVPAHQPSEVATGYLNAYRILISDLVVLTMCEAGTGFEALAAAVRRVKPLPIVATVLRPRPLADVAGRRVAFFTTAPPPAHEPLAAHLRDAHGAAEVVVSGNLGDRAALRDDLERADGDVYLVELKAAAVDVVAEAGLARGREVVLAEAELRPVAGEPDLDAHLRALADEAALVPTVPG